MYPPAPQVTYSQDTKYPSTASQNTLKYFSIIYVTSSLRTLLKTTFDAFWLTASGFTGSQTCALQNTLYNLNCKYSMSISSLWLHMWGEKPLENKQNHSYTLPYGKDFSYRRTVNVLSRKIAQLSICASIKLSKQLSARNRGDLLLAVGRKS